jgi:hypothetical protein
MWRKLLFCSPCWFPFHLLGIPLFVWCDPVHLGPRLLVNWPPLPQPLPHSLPISNSQHPRLIVRHAKTTLRSRLHRVRNSQYLVSVKFLFRSSFFFVAIITDEIINYIRRLMRRNGTLEQCPQEVGIFYCFQPPPRARMNVFLFTRDRNSLVAYILLLNFHFLDLFSFLFFAFSTFFRWHFFICYPTCKTVWC